MCGYSCLAFAARLFHAKPGLSFSFANCPTIPIFCNLVRNLEIFFQQCLLLWILPRNGLPAINSRPSEEGK
jgi:hypothetical protein